MPKLTVKITHLIFYILVLFSGHGIAQTETVVLFKANEFQQFGFDAFEQNEWIGKYDSIEILENSNYRIPWKSVAYNFTDDVDAIFRSPKNISSDSLSFFVEGSTREIRSISRNDSTRTLFLPKMTSNYKVIALYRNKVVGKLNVVVYKLNYENIVVVPFPGMEVDRDSLEMHLNKIYAQANFRFNVYLGPYFRPEDFKKEDLLANPSPVNDRYTNQMREYRDAFFNRYPKSNKKALYIFLVPGFTNPTITGYMVRSKGVAFVKIAEEKTLVRSIARELGHGIGMLTDSWRNEGPKRKSTLNLMDDGQGIHLCRYQWEDLQHASHSYSFYDNYEDVFTNNGIVAYYFWKEDKKGHLILEKDDLLASISRPYKKNYISYHLDIRDFIFQTVFTLFEYRINLVHLGSVFIIFLSGYIMRRKFKAKLEAKLKRPFIWKILLRVTMFSLVCLLSYLSFIFINKGYERYEVSSGLIREMDGLSSRQAVKMILRNKNVKHRAEDSMISEILVKKGSRWHMKKRKPVLYFEVVKDSLNAIKYVQLKGDSDSLMISTHHYSQKANSHYLVFNELNEQKELIDQKVYNHLGMDITSKITLKDPSKRILLLVNGYRPTSVGHTFEENFKDIQAKGLEYPNSQNLIYSFDRYDYWEPWQQINRLFEKRINPSETYYADGHFSVSTSNHESLINFTTLSTIYPKRCANKHKHVCYHTTVTGSGLFGSRQENTIDLLPTDPNKKGFNLRRRNGRIAGRNLLQIFNEIPNRSANDTLFIVAHSMGFAYALGILDELRGKINFGGIYVLAPENASSGKLDPEEWEEIWQYGSNFEPKGHDAPCLQDGVAPQKSIKGIGREKRVFIPRSNYKQKGFFDSHFVGYYTWIFQIKEHHKGYIKQR